METWKEIKREVREMKERFKSLEEKIERATKEEGCAVAEGSTPTTQPGGSREEERRKKEDDEQESQERCGREKRKENIIIKGKRVGERNWKEECRRILREAAGREVEVSKEWERGDGKGGKIWITEVKKEEDKKKILSNSKEIVRKERISIDRDRTYEEREAMWWTRQEERELREKGKEVEIREGMIKNEGWWWRWDAKLKVWMRMVKCEDVEEAEKEK